jgi:Transcriptional regulator, AbiEi antitoxin
MAALPERWSQLRRLATPQHGLVTRQQALAAGFSASAISRAVARGEWVRVVPGVFALSGVGVTPKQRVAAAVLADASVAATVWTAMWLWQLLRTAPSSACHMAGGVRRVDGSWCTARAH